MLFRHARHFLATKGPRHALERTAEVCWRFALGGRRFDRTLDLIERDLGSRGVRMTFCVTAGLISRHRRRIERLAALGHEIASHGLFHSRMDFLDYDRQLEVLRESYRFLSDAGFRVKGFRCPYLNSNADTGLALEESPYRWTSGDLIFWRNGFAPNATVHRLDLLYRIWEADERMSLPEVRGARVEVPLSAPDDEILYERYRVRDPEVMLEIWREVSDQVWGRGELHHLLFHPERYPRVRGALMGLLDRAAGRRPVIWTPTLGELACWWRARSAWGWRRMRGGVRVDAPEGALLLLKAPREAADGSRSCRDPRLFGDYAPLERAETYPALTVGLSPRCPERLEAFLHEEGFLAERSESPAGHGMYVDRPDFADRDRRGLLEEIDRSPGPLLRLWRWPGEYRAALVLSADICAIDLRDFVDRTAHF
jgi:peptidoglycan/xylan/chitin deacetylase (PgdA/CDA1 family)